MFFLLNFGYSMNISRYLCAANIDGNMYNFSSTFTKVQKLREGSNTFLFHPCRALTINDFPENATVDLDGANIYRLLPSKKWQPINYITDFDWSLTNDGVVYGADGLLKESPDGKWDHFDFDFECRCDPNKVNPDPSFIHFIVTSEDDYGNVHKKITLSFSSSAGCPKSGFPVPTPEPKYEFCDFVSRMDGNPNRGIDAHLDVLNQNPWGIRERVLFDTINMTLFYKACGKMNCPLEFECEEDEMESSIYLCPEFPEPGLHCQSFGIASQEHSHISLYGKDERNGLRVDYAGHMYKTVMHMTQSPTSYPEGFMEVNKKTHFDVGRMELRLEASTHEADLTTIPDPPEPGAGQCYSKGSSGTATIELNLTSYNKENGYIEEVSIVPKSTQKGKLYYQPCGSLQCPENHSCKGVEDSSVMLCYNDNTCISYGQMANNVTIKYDKQRLNDGFITEYRSGRYKSLVTYKCRKDISKGNIRINEEVVRDGTSLKFIVESSDVCPDSPLPPEKPWFMPTPKPYSSPIPTPMPSPNPINFYHNETHFIVMNLEELKDSVVSYTTTIYHNSNKAPVFFKYSAWDNFSCPSEYGECQRGENDVGNAYLCFETEQRKKVCYSYADIRYDAHLDLVGYSLDNGVDLTYNSIWDTDLSIEISCDPDIDFNILNVHKGSELIYGKGLRGEIISLTAESNNACPIPFEKEYYPPTPKPTLEPPPISSDKYYHRSNTVNGYYIDLDLTKLAAHTQEVFLGHWNTFHRSKIIFDADSPRSCGLERECLGGGFTNLWKCFTVGDTKREVCYGIGDARQGLTFHSSKINLNEGITATFPKGYNMYTTAIQFVCNESIASHIIDFEDIGIESAQFKRITLYAHTSDVCPKKDTGPTTAPTPLPTETPNPTEESEEGEVEPGKRPVTGGSVFLLVVIIVVISYLCIGLSVVYLGTGRFELPNTSFWTDFFLNIETAVVFISTCGKKQSCRQTSYDTI